MFYSVLLSNHPVTKPLGHDPKVAIVGLSPAATQITEFIQAYTRTKDYDEASIEGAFAGLAGDIIAMLNGLGISERFGLAFESGGGLARHPQIHVTSLVACATLTSTGSSTDFAPSSLQAARNCMSKRFVPEVCSPSFPNLKLVIILGAKGWKAASKEFGFESSILDQLRAHGKKVLNLPHPSGANRELVNLASLKASELEDCDKYVERKWKEFIKKKPEKRHTEQQYKSARQSRWENVANLRREAMS